jgi:hypothetical protein
LGDGDEVDGGVEERVWIVEGLVRNFQVEG